MMRMTVLASGSRGNSTIVATGQTRLLVDAGLSCRELMKRMVQAEEDPETLDAIVITHEHQDHVQGLGVLARKLDIPVYFTEATHRAWMRWMAPQKKMTYAEWMAARQAANPRVMGESSDSEDIVEAGAGADPDGVEARDAEAEVPAAAAKGRAAKAPAREKTAAELTHLPAVEYFRAGATFCVGDIEITAFTIPHDAADPVGFVFRAEGLQMAIATDLGYVPQNVCAALRKCDVLMMESNHDVEMLRNGPYPWSVKQRVMSRVGHLSNHALADFFSTEYDGSAQYVVLAHLSESNNLPEMARLCAEQALSQRMPLLLNRLILAAQDEPLAPILV
jgi:phosphoribosyl 1,2-cyclic phosphodiesterase